jgi:hypothetical protein
MKTYLRFFALVVCAVVVTGTSVLAQTDPLPSWNDGAAKQAILDFVKATTDQSSPNFVAPEARIATFDQDGTLWVEHPVYTQVVYCLDRVPTVVKTSRSLLTLNHLRRYCLATGRQSLNSRQMSYSRYWPSHSPA